MSLGSLPPDVLFGIALPVAWAAFFWLLSFPVWAREVKRPKLVLIAVAAPFIMAIPGMREVPQLPPTNADGWLFYIGIFALVSNFGCCGACGGSRCSLSIGLSSALLVAALCVFPLFQSGADTLPQALVTAAAICIGSFFTQWSLRAVSARASRESIYICFILSAALSVLLIFSGSAYLGLLIASCAAALGPGVAGSLLRRDAHVPIGAMSALGVLFSACLAQGYLYADTPLESALLYAAAPGICALGPGWKRLVGLLCFLTLSLLLAAIGYFGL